MAATETPSSVALGYRPRLDGMRAIAVSLVVADHCFDRTSAGLVGVGTFFVLSGFLITTIIDAERAATGTVNLRFFYMRRILRLYPALVALVLVFLIALPFGVWRGGVGLGLGAAAMALTYTTDIFTVVGKGHWIAFELLLTWTLAVEEQFYLLWPITYSFLMRRFPTWRARMTVLGGGIVFAAAVRSVGFTKANIAQTPLAWTDALLIGCCLGLAYRNGWFTPRRLHPLILVMASLPAVHILWQGENRFDQIIGLTLFDLGIAVWIVHALATPRRDWLGSKPLARLGRISYGMYLWHSLVLNLMVKQFDDNNVPFFVAAYALSVIAAELSYRFIESPFLRRKDRFSVA